MFLRKIMLYPLRRGADYRKDACLTMRDDSSPPTRGRQKGEDTISEIHRFIPSCEGQTQIILHAPCSFTIHPLLQGADNTAAIRRVIGHDSSPLARGRPCTCLVIKRDARFIPSCKGQTHIATIQILRYMIHPLLQGADALSLEMLQH